MSLMNLVLNKDEEITPRGVSQSEELQAWNLRGWLEVTGPYWHFFEGIKESLVPIDIFLKE